MKTVSLALAFGLLAAPALAQDPTGDAAAGESAFKQCQTCHVVVDADGNTLAGKSAKTGPNLYGTAGGAIGAADFRYSKPFMALAETGATWDEASFVAYVMDPLAYLREATGDPKARGKMAYKVRKEEDAVNLYAYIASLGAGS